MIVERRVGIESSLQTSVSGCSVVACVYSTKKLSMLMYIYLLFKDGAVISMQKREATFFKKDNVIW